MRIKMAISRPPVTGPYCGEDIWFSYNPLTKDQINSGWCGDTGGSYDYVEHSKVCKQQIRDKKLNSLIGPTCSSIEEFLEYLKGKKGTIDPNTGI